MLPAGEIPVSAEIYFEISAPLVQLNNSAIRSTLTVHFQWEGQTVGERIGHPPSQVKAKKMIVPWLPQGMIFFFSCYPGK